MDKIYDSMLQAIGGTPMIRLHRIPGPDDAEMLVKYEGLGGGGSVKSRTALSLIEDAERKGLIRPGYSILTECTTGNQGVGIAFVAAIKGYQAVICLPSNYGIERAKLIRAYGAKVIRTPVMEDQMATILRCRQACIELKASDPDRVFWLQQFSNPANRRIHMQRTAAEILYQTDGRLDAIVHSVGTGGTLGGVSRVLKLAIPDIKVFCTEPEKGAMEALGRHGLHKQQGIGDGQPVRHLDRSLIDGFIQVTDEEAYTMSRRLAAEEGILCGVSSGTSACGALKVAHELGKGKRVLSIAADTGERYLETDLYELED